MKRVALVNPGKGKKYAQHEPLNLGFIASYLEKHGAEVSIIDELAGQDVRKELLSCKPDVVGITATTPLVPYAYKVAKMCKEMGLLTVMGGVHASVLPEEALQHVDVVVKGEGETAMLDIAKGDITSGIVTRPYIKDIDEVLPPARHLLDMDFYLGTRDRLLQALLNFVPPHTRVATMLTSRGCPYNCVFCHNSWRGLPVRFNSAERVVAELRHLVGEYGVGAVFFGEDHFFLNKRRVEEICRLISKERIEIVWGASARVDGVDEGILGIAREAGCRAVFLGFESGSQRILDVLGKGTTVEQNYEAVRVCRKVGIEPVGSIMIGSPTEMIEDIRMTKKFLEDTGLSNVGVVITTPYPGTALWNWCKERNLIPSTVKWEDMDCDNIAIPACDTIPVKDIKRLQMEIKGVIVGKRPLRFLALVKRGRVHPKDLLMFILHPLMLLKVLIGIVKAWRH